MARATRTRRAAVKRRSQIETPAAAARTPAVGDVVREAYPRFERRGGAHGGDIADWLEAERLARVRAERSRP